MNSNNSNNFKVFTGIRSFIRLEGGFISVTDVETKFSVIEEIKCVYDILKLLLTEERFNVLDRELLAGNEVVYNFMTNKLSFVRTKEDKEMNEFFSKEMNLGAIRRRSEDSEEKDKYFLK